MGKTLEDIFISEFKSSTMNTNWRGIYNIPLPPECSKWAVSGTEVYAVKGITDTNYSALDKKLVSRRPSGYVAKRRKINKGNRTFLQDEKGNYVYEDFAVPNKSIVVVSDINIDLPYLEYKKKVTKEGYGYIDFIDRGNRKVDYLYVLPKSVLYRANQTALALSVKSMKNFSGRGYVTWNDGIIYLHIIPYKPNSKYEGTKILKTGFTLNYSKEVNTLLNFWQQQGVLPALSLCGLVDGRNIAIRETNVTYDSWLPVESIALSDKEIYGDTTDGTEVASGSTSSLGGSASGGSAGSRK